MKKLIGIVIILALTLSSASFAFADSADSEAVPVLISATPSIEVSYLDEVIKYDVIPQRINGGTMIPLRATLEKMGYDIEWNGNMGSVEISKGAQWTSVKINNNSYFKNKMAPIKLSSAPIIIEGRTLVPAEFFNSILDKGLLIENGDLKINDFQMTIHSGYIKDMVDDGNGNISITITQDMTSTDMLDYTIIHTSDSTTYYNHEIKKGEYINAICSLAMTMSIPGQTSGYIIY